MKRTGYALIVFVAGMAATTAAHAADHKFYIGLDVGQANFDSTEIFDNPVRSSDDTSMTFTIKAGYRFNRYFALEGGYSDLGDYEATQAGLCLPVGPTPICGGEVRTRTSIDGVMVTAIGILPLTQHFELTASAGAIYREVDYDYRISANESRSLSDEGTVMKFGVGAGFPINERFELGLDVTTYREVGVGISSASGEINTVNDGESTVVTLGARWRF